MGDAGDVEGTSNNFYEEKKINKCGIFMFVGV
jgi:hypothetical protein